MRARHIFLVGLLFLLAFGCKKENTRFSYHDGIDGAQNFVTAQQMITQLLNTYFKSLTDSSLIHNQQAKIDGAEVYFYEDPERILIKYPYWGNSDGYGHWRMNYYEAFPETSFQDPEVKVDFVFTDFSFDKDTLYVTDLVVQHMGKVDGANDHFSVTAEMIDRYYTDSTGILQFSMDQLFVRHKDPTTIYTSMDDQFIVSGKMNGITRSLLDFEANILPDTSSLLNSFSCTWLREGVTQVDTEGFSYPAYALFPDQDTCQNQYLIMINDNPFPYPIDY